MNDFLKIFVYNKNGEKIKEDLYSNFIFIFNEVLDHNIEYEEDEWNIIHGFSFPPEDLIWDNTNKEWIEKEKGNFKIKKNNIFNPIRIF